MARDTDDDAPWLAEGVPEASRMTLVPRGRLLGGVAIFALLSALVAVGFYVIAAGKKSNGASVGVVRAEDAPLITADPGPYKTLPTTPGGLAVEGADQTIYSAGTGNDPGGTIDPSRVPEEPLARPTAVPAGGPPKDLLAPTLAAGEGGTPRDAVAPAELAPVRITPTLPPVAPAPAAAHLRTPSDLDPRPRGGDAKVATVVLPKTKPVVAPQAATAPPAAGNVAVQLGAFSTEAKAEAAWTRVAARHPELTGFRHRIASLDRDGATLYRLRASGSGDAATVCAALAAAGDACLVAK